MVQTYNIVILLICMVKATIGQDKEYASPPVVSNKCTKLGICDTVENYPTDLAQKLIQELKDKDALFLDDSVLDIIQDFGQPNTYQEDRNIEKNRFRPTLVERFGTSSEEEVSEENEGTQLCETSIHYHIPKIAENRNNTWKFILNDDRKPVQTFRTERCKSKHSKCSEAMNFIPNYGGMCVQRWTLKEMYYIDDDGKSATDYFKVPTCCSCRLFHKNK